MFLFSCFFFEISKATGGIEPNHVYLWPGANGESEAVNLLTIYCVPVCPEAGPFFAGPRHDMRFTQSGSFAT